MEKNIKRFKNVIVGLSVLICVFVIIPFLINCLFLVEAPADIFVARWKEADALSYTSGALSFLGTIFLGWISWRQNEQLQRIEKNSFISQNCCIVYLEKMCFNGLKNRIINIDSEHIEPIVVDTSLNDNDISLFNYSSFSLNVSMKLQAGYVSYVRVDSLTILFGKSELQSWIFTESYDECYSPVAMSVNTLLFELAVILKNDLKEKIIQSLNDNCKIFIEIIIEIVSPTYVSSKMKCTGSFSKKTDSLNHYEFSLLDKSPVCLYLKNDIIDLNSVVFRNDKKLSKSRYR